MITIEEKIKEMHEKEQLRIQKDIKLYGTVYKANPKGNPHIPFKLLELEEKLKIDSIYIDDIYGWPYFDDVNYLSMEQQDDFDELMEYDFVDYNMKDYSKKLIFKHINKLVYYFNEADRLLLTQKKANRGRKPSLSIEILKALKSSYDEETDRTLLQILLDTGEKFDENALSYNQKIYLAGMNKKREISKIKLNLNRLKSLKEKYANEVELLIDTIEQTSKKHIDDVMLNILKSIELPKYLISTP